MKLLNKVKIIFLLLLIVMGGLFLSTKTNAQDTGCYVSSVGWFRASNDFSEGDAILTIRSEECAALIVEIWYVLDTGVATRWKTPEADNPKMPELFFPEKVDGTNMDRISIKFLVGEDNVCYGDNGGGNGPWGNTDCVLFARVLNGDNGQVLFSPRGPNGEFDITHIQQYNNSLETERKNGILRGYCNGACNWGVWKYDRTTYGNIPSAEGCNLSNAAMHFDYKDYNGIRPFLMGEMVKLNIRTLKNCRGVPLTIKLWEQDNSGGDNTIDFLNLKGSKADSLDVVAPFDEDLWITFRVGEDDCDGDESTNVWDCTVYVQVLKNGYEIATSEYWLGESSGDGNANYQSGNNFLNKINFYKGVFVHECSVEGDCVNWSENDWKVIDTNSKGGNVDGIVFNAEPVTYDPTNPCYIPATKTKSESYDPNCYEFLAPIPGIELDANGNADQNFITSIDQRTGQTRIAIRDITKYQLGSFINKLFQIAVAILGVVAVIMIVVAGVEYMTTEAIYNKGEAKKKITSAATGLILALGIFIILNTINPQLLQINFGQNLKQVELKVLDGLSLSNSESTAFATAPPVTPGYYTLPTTGPVSSCSGERVIEGVRQTHGALDFELDSGTAIFAAADGKVSRTQSNCPNQRNDSCGNGFGNKIYISHNNGEESIYAHLSKVLVNKNATVKKGQKIGLSGNSGHSLGPHLHFQVQERSTLEKRNLDSMSPSCS